MPIDNYNDLLDGEKFLEGQVTNAGSNIEARTAFNGSSDIIVFGRAVFKGSRENHVTSSVDNSSIFLGVAQRTDTIEMRYGYSLTDNGDMGYPANTVNTMQNQDLTGGTPLSYLFHGAIAVKLQSDVNQFDSVFVWIGKDDYQDTFRNSASGSNTIAVPEAMFLKSGKKSDIVPLFIK